MKKPKIIKKWQTINVVLNDAYIDADFHYETGKYYMSNGQNDSNVTFNAENATVDIINKHLDRAKCVIAALEYIKTELKL